MASFKEIEINHPKKGRIKLGSLSKNDLCRGMRDMLMQLQIAQRLFVVSQNHVASTHACSPEDRAKI